MSCIGVNIGALSVKVAALRGKSRTFTVLAHQGRPLAVLDELLATPEFGDAEFFGLSGAFGNITEVASIQRALLETAEGFDAVASLGGESFLIYILTAGRISNVLSHNKCAAGSGEFFIQQIGRMGIGVEEAIRLSFEGKVVPLAARCSVYCKSDITHKLNRHEATAEDVLHTLHDSMANKVIALLEKSQRDLKRVLLIGGVTQNAAMLAALREKKTSVKFIVREESHCFEAWGCSLLVRDKPRHRALQTLIPLRFDNLPPLRDYASLVHIITPPSGHIVPEGLFVLGVDSGSTTTKAVLLDPETRNLVASHYARTNGDPIMAMRKCLRSMAEAAGNRAIGIVATTGSARELVGAYLGTAHVYNEISAHAAGASHYDSEVETVFEIGGQDSKYISLRNGVPIDYAMNNACSAGTGSFLEESAHGDLGIEVGEIASIALSAPSPVQFKTNCAAFINSDIRIAQQQGRSRDDIVAGLVYSVAGNYLNRVKGPRPVGKKVFLQGGVALNAAVGHAFAHNLGRPVVIPPNPELLGAIGVALLAMKRSGSPAVSTGDLLSLAAPEMKHSGRFTCRACTMFCSIDRFDVAGRHFPFGGKCSLFEHSCNSSVRSASVPDFVDQRANLIFNTPLPRMETKGVESSAAPSAWHFTAAVAAAKSFLEERLGGEESAATPIVPIPARIGIPRALTTHSLYPLYSSFFNGIGMEVILSGIDPAGDLKANSGFCFPAQIAHGAVLDMVRKNVELVFLPHVTRMPQPNACHDSLLCPITQASPYFMTKAFPRTRFISPVLDFTSGYYACKSLIELVVTELGVSREVANAAWSVAVRAQNEVELEMRELGRKALAGAISDGKPAILLAGHSYNAFTPEASQSVSRKLASMGITAIPADCLVSEGEGPTAWHFANQIMNAVTLVKRFPNLFLLSVSNFSCTIDAFTHSMLASELGAKPYLLLEIDAATADAGVQTRLEAFLDIIRNYRAACTASGTQFVPARLDKDGCVIRAAGERVLLTDPRVKIYLPNFSQYHTQTLGLAIRWLGMHPGNIGLLSRAQLDLGLQHTSGRECLPLPISIGQILQIHRQRGPGEISGFYSVRGGAPCVSDAYLGYFERFIAEHRLSDFFIISAAAENSYLGYDEITLARHVSLAITIADILIEMDHVLRVVGETGSIGRLETEWEHFMGGADTMDTFNSGLPAFVKILSSLPRTRDPRTCPRVIVTGDFFTRFSPFFMQGVRDLYASRGIILKPDDLSDLILYGAYDGIANAADSWGMKPGNLALAKACTRIFHSDGKQYLQNWLAYQTELRMGQSYRKIFAASGLLVASDNGVADLFEHAAEHVSPKIYGETIPAVGKGLDAALEGYDGTLLVGPFNCLPYRISEAILRPLSLQRGMPMLTYESDGYAVEPAFLRQVEVHIQQVLDHAARRRTV